MHCLSLRGVCHTAALDLFPFLLIVKKKKHYIESNEFMLALIPNILSLKSLFTFENWN